MNTASPIDNFSLEGVRARIAAAASVTLSGVSNTRTVVQGQDLLFATSMDRDPIQRAHREGRFYEEVEVSVMNRVLPFGGSFVDIGANIGNHGLYAAIFLHARVVPFEPNPPACKLLIANFLMNGLEGQFDLSHLGLGLSDAATGGYAMQARDSNLGGAKMLPGERTLEVRRGDDLLGDVTPDLIKIDVESMELAVLAGLSATIARSRPWLQVEVDLENEAAFLDWVTAHAYAVDLVHRRNRANKNYVLGTLLPRVVRRTVGAMGQEGDL